MNLESPSAPLWKIPEKLKLLLDYEISCGYAPIAVPDLHGSLHSIRLMNLTQANHLNMFVLLSLENKRIVYHMRENRLLFISRRHIWLLGGPAQGTPLLGAQRVIQGTTALHYRHTIILLPACTNFKITYWAYQSIIQKPLDKKKFNSASSQLRRRLVYVNHCWGTTNINAIDNSTSVHLLFSETPCYNYKLSHYFLECFTIYFNLRISPAIFVYKFIFCSINCHLNC